MSAAPGSLWGLAAAPLIAGEPQTPSLLLRFGVEAWQIRAEAT
jgi:hypothetical protein